MLTEDWDKVPNAQQEAVMDPTRRGGAPLGRKRVRPTDLAAVRDGRPAIPAELTRVPVAVGQREGAARIIDWSIF